MKIAVIGTGYVGLVAGTCFAETGNDVTCVDTDEDKIALLKKGQIPIYEPGLEEMVKRNAKEARLSFSTDVRKAVSDALVVFIAVGTPPGEDGSSDLRYLLSAARETGKAMNGYKIVVIKSTAPVGTADKVREVIKKETTFEFDVISNPEFLKEGTAVEDFMKPDRVVIGHGEVRAAEFMKELYAPFTRTGAPILLMDNRSAEMAKYAANAMLATRVSFMNEIANLCEHIGADVQRVRQAVGLDRRIGPTFLFAGIGYGGSCFPKDIKALIQLAKDQACRLDLIRSAEKVNERQKRLLIRKILAVYAPTADENTTEQVLAGMTFAVWGLSFKPQTDDMREAPSVVIISRLLELGATVKAYDPVAMSEARKIFGSRLEYNEDNYEVLRGADALLLVTEWNVFRNPDFSRMTQLMSQPVIFDGRNQYDPEEMERLGIRYFGIGRGLAACLDHRSPGPYPVSQTGEVELGELPS
jgi:UDPglucose 6-dehydrogenase